MMLDDGLFLYPAQVKHLWFQQKLIEAISQRVIVHSNTKDGDGGDNLVATNRTSVPWPRINFVDLVSWRNTAICHLCLLPVQTEIP